MILKFQDQRIHIWRHHSGTFYQQPLMKQKILIMEDRINLIPSISIEKQLPQVRLQKGGQFKEYQRLHSEKKS